MPAAPLTAEHSLYSPTTGEPYDTEVAEKKEFSSRDDAGMVTIDTVMTNQEDESVFEGDMKFTIERKP